MKCELQFTRFMVSCVRRLMYDAYRARVSNNMEEGCGNDTLEIMDPGVFGGHPPHNQTSSSF